MRWIINVCLFLFVVCVKEGSYSNTHNSLHHRDSALCGKPSAHTHTCKQTWLTSITDWKGWMTHTIISCLTVSFSIFLSRYYHSHLFSRCTFYTPAAGVCVFVWLCVRVWMVGWDVCLESWQTEREHWFTPFHSDASCLFLRRETEQMNFTSASYLVLQPTRVHSHFCVFLMYFSFHVLELN